MNEKFSHEHGIVLRDPGAVCGGLNGTKKSQAQIGPSKSLQVGQILKFHWSQLCPSFRCSIPSTDNCLWGWHGINSISFPRVFIPLASGKEKRLQTNPKRAKFDWLLKNGFISWRIHFYFLFPQSLENILIVQSIVVELYCGGRICHIFKRLMVLGCACYKQLFLKVVRCLVRRPLMHAQLFNWNQNFLAPVLDYSRAFCSHSTVGCGNHIGHKPWSVWYQCIALTFEHNQVNCYEVAMLVHRKL